MFIATSTYRRERGETVNDFGDESDTPSNVAEGLHGSVMEARSTSFQDSESRSGQVSSLVGRFRTGVKLVEGDRLVDERTNDTYVITNVRNPSNVLIRSDVVVDLRREGV